MRCVDAPGGKRGVPEGSVSAKASRRVPGLSTDSSVRSPLARTGASSPNSLGRKFATAAESVEGKGAPSSPLLLRTDAAGASP